MKKFLNKKYLYPLLILLLSVCLFFFKLGYSDVVKWDESTNADVVYETLHSQNPWILQFGGQPFLEKPPLWYYLTMMVVKIGGFNEINLRLISALSGILVTTMIYLLGKGIKNIEAGLWSALAFLGISQLFFFYNTNPFSTHLFRSADVDGLQILLITSAVGCFLVEKNRTKWLYIGIILSGLAFLTKGPLGLLPLIVYCVLNWKAFSKVIWLKGFLLLVLIILPWHVFMYLKIGPDFVRQYLEYHLLSRTVTALEGHREPIWFYVVNLFKLKLSMLGILLPVSLWINRHNLKQWWQRKNYQFVLIIVLSLFILITIMQTKLAWYILPVYPFLSLMLGLNLAEFQEKSQINEKLPLLLKLAVVGLVIFNVFMVINLPYGPIQSQIKDSKTRCGSNLTTISSDDDRDVQYLRHRYQLESTFEPQDCQLFLRRSAPNQTLDLELLPPGAFIH